MKIAVCLFKYFPYGGLQRDFIAISRELLSRGHTLVIYTGRWEGVKPEGFDIRLLPSSGIGNHTRNRRFYEQLKQCLIDEPVDVVLGFNKMPGLDVYFCADTCFATKAYEDKGWLYRLTPRCKWSLAYEEAVVGSSSSAEILLLSHVEGEAFQRYYNTPAERLRLIPPGIKRDRIRNENSQAQGDNIRQELGIAQQDKLLAFLGSDYKRKGLDRLLLAVASLPQENKDRVKVLVIGRDKRLPEFHRLASHLNIDDKVIFVGQRDDVPPLLFASDYLVHPAYLENSGNAILEAVVAGMPVLCTEKCGNSIYIRNDQLGWVIPEPFDQEQMNTLLYEALNSKVEWRQRCADFAKTADIYSSPLRIAEIVEEVGTRKWN